MDHSLAPSCVTVALQSVQARLARLEDLLSNLAHLHRKDLMMRYGISARTVDRWQAEGRLPPAIRIGGPLWRLVDLEAAEQSGQLPPPQAQNGVSVPVSVHPTVHFTVHPSVQV